MTLRQQCLIKRNRNFLEQTLVVLLIIYESYKMSHIPRVDYDALSILRDALTFLGGAKGCQAALEWFQRRTH